MDNSMRSKRISLVALVALAIALAVSAPSQARGMGGHGFEGGHVSEGTMHHGFEGHHFEGHHFDRDAHGRFGFGFVPGPVFPDYGYSEAPPYSSYYCPSYGAYYPDAASCPEAWVEVPAS
jgi:hypothetical protein